MPLTEVQEKLKKIPDEYLVEVYNYLELLDIKSYTKNKTNLPRKSFQIVTLEF